MKEVSVRAVAEPPGFAAPACRGGSAPPTCVHIPPPAAVLASGPPAPPCLWAAGGALQHSSGTKACGSCFQSAPQPVHRCRASHAAQPRSPHLPSTALHRSAIGHAQHLRTAAHAGTAQAVADRPQALQQWVDDALQPAAARAWRAMHRSSSSSTPAAPASSQPAATASPSQVVALSVRRAGRGAELEARLLQPGRRHAASACSVGLRAS